MKKVLSSLFTILFVGASLAASNISDAVTDAVYVVEPEWKVISSTTAYDTVKTTNSDTIYYGSPASGWEYFLVVGPFSVFGQDSAELILKSTALDANGNIVTGATMVDTVLLADSSTGGTPILLPWWTTQCAAKYRLTFTGGAANDKSNGVALNRLYIGRRQPAINTPAVGHSLPR